MPKMIIEEVRPNAPPVAGKTYAQLMQTHPDYDGELWEKLHLLYEGGFEILKHASEFVPQLPGEPADRYRWRLEHTSYMGYFAQVVGYLAGGLFQSELHITPASDANNPSTPGEVPDKAFYSEFGRNCDQQGTSVSGFLQKALIDALVYKRAVVCTDMPPAPEVLNRADEEKLGGGRAYLYHVPIEQLLDWKLDDAGGFVWCILHDVLCDRDTPEDDRSTRRERFKIWRMLNGVAHFEVYETREIPADEQIQPDDIIPLVTPSTPTSFEQIPLVELRLPKALWAGNQAGPLAQEHFRDRSDLSGSMSRALVEIPYVKLGPEIPEVHGQLPSQAQQDPNRGDSVHYQYMQKGVAVLGSEDELGFASPSGIAFTLKDKQCQDLRDEIFRCSHAMALSLANTSASVARSGVSKREDRSATEIVLAELSTLVCTFATKLYTVVSDGRNEDVVWTTHGLDQFSLDDTQELLDEAPVVLTAGIRSPTFQKEYEKKFAFGVLPKLSPATKAQVSTEIDASVDEKVQEEAEMRQMQRDGMQKSLDEPAAPGGKSDKAAE